MKNVLRKAIALTLSMTLVLSTVPAYAATTNELSMAPEVSAVTSWALGKISDVAIDTAINFGKTNIMNWLFPSKSATEERLDEISDKFDALSSKLDAISANQEKMLSKLSEMEDFLTNEQYTTILNEYKDFRNKTTFVNYCYNTLVNLEGEDEEQLAEDQLSVLTDEMGIKSYDDANTLIDQKRSEYFNYITSQYYVQVNGKLEQRNLLGIYRELMKNIYFWENTAADQINEFNEEVVSNYLFITLVDILSIEARIAQIKKYNEAHPDSKLKTNVLNRLLTVEIPQETKQVLELYHKYGVDIPDNLLHFWGGDSDIWFDKTAFATGMGKEAQSVAHFTTSMFIAGQAVTIANGWGGPNYEFSQSYTKGVYQKDYFKNLLNEKAPEKSSLLSTEIVNEMLAAKDNTVSFGDILKEAGFTTSNKLDYVLLNTDDPLNEVGTRNDVIYFDNSMEFNETRSYLRFVDPATKQSIEKNGAPKVDAFSYIDVTQRGEFKNAYANQIILQCDDKTPCLIDCERLFVYDSTEGLDTCGHSMFTERHNIKAPTSDEEGYTGDVVCLKCGKTIETGTSIPKLFGGTHTHNFTGDIVKGEGQNVGKHAYKCTGSNCEAVGYMDGDTPVEGWLACEDKNNDNKCDSCGQELSNAKAGKSKSSSGDKLKDVRTGDTINIGLWLILMLVSLETLIVAIIVKRRRKHNTD